MPQLRPTRAWSFAAIALAFIVSLPILAVLSRVGADSEGVWSHLAQTVLSEYLSNTLALLVGVSLGACLIGTATAWLVTMYRFPGRRLLTLALLMPLAMPTYLMAYTYTDLLQFTGPLQTWLRETFAWERGEYWFPTIRSLGGATVTLSLVLYPYVYLLARAAFLEQSLCVLEVSRTLGRGPLRSFLFVALPLARPAIAAGITLVMMETLAEYGAMDYFAVDTFTTGIYRTWTSLGSPEAASQLAVALVTFVFLILALERRARRGSRYAPTSARHRPIRRRQLTGSRAALAMFACATPFLFGFCLPVGVLTQLAWEAPHTMSSSELPELITNTLGIAVASSLVVVCLGLLITYAGRLGGGALEQSAARLVALGYAIPGAVIAVGVLVTFGALTDITGFYVGGTLIALVYAYSVRFSSVSIQALDSGLEKIRPNMDHAARTLGASPGALLKRVHMPLLRGSILTACLLVFVEAMKELPATMILRPYDFNTLAVQVHRYASDERLAQSALPALLIVAAGLIPVALLGRSIDRSRAGAGLPR